MRSEIRTIFLCPTELLCDFVKLIFSRKTTHPLAPFKVLFNHFFTNQSLVLGNKKQNCSFLGTANFILLNSKICAENFCAQQKNSL